MLQNAVMREQRATLLFEGDSGFCRTWVDDRQQLTGVSRPWWTRQITERILPSFHPTHPSVRDAAHRIGELHVETAYGFRATQTTHHSSRLFAVAASSRSALSVFTAKTFAAAHHDLRLSDVPDTHTRTIA